MKIKILSTDLEDLSEGRLFYEKQIEKFCWYASSVRGIKAIPPSDI